MATPYLDEAERCSRVALLNNGVLLEADTPQRIKERMKGSVVEIVLPEVRRAYTFLKETPEFSSVQAFGDRLNIVLQDPNTELPKLRKKLADAGYESAQERIIPTSLENVFISLMTETTEVAA